MAAQNTLADRTMVLRAEAAALSSSDRLGSLLSKSFDLLGQLQKEELEASDLEFGLQSLEAERELVKKHDRIPSTPLRSIVYGLVETLHDTVDKMRNERRIGMKEQPPSVGAAAAAAAVAPPPPFDIAPLMAAFTSAAAASALTLATEMKKKTPGLFEAPKEEPFDEISFKAEDIWGDEMAIKNEENGDTMGDMGDGYDFVKEDIDKTMNKDNEMMSEEGEKDSSEIDGVENKGRPSRNVSRSARFTPYTEPVAKKQKMDLSKQMLNFVIPEQKTATPQCILCEAYPKTPYGYTYHLYSHHKSTLLANGLYLLCACGAKYRQGKPYIKHADECTHTNYTVHKIADD